MIRAPKGWHWLEPLMASVHRSIILKYTHCWIPDYAGTENLSGELSHKYPLPRNAKFIGPLTRFPVKQPQNINENNTEEPSDRFDIVAELSGLEPQRSMLEKQLIDYYIDKEEKVLIVRGKTNMPNTTVQNRNITVVPDMNDLQLQCAVQAAKTIIARSGYSTIMDLHALGCLYKASLVATPGQPEQEYLASIH